MRFRRPTSAYLIVLAAILAGCRSGGDTEALIRENQQREEYALHLQVQLDQCCRELRATRDLLAAQEQSGSGGSRRGTGDESSPSDRPKPPKIDLGPSGGKEPTPAPKFEPGGKAGTGGPDASIGPELGQMHNVATRRGQQVVAITLDRQLTAGFDADEAQPGDEGMVVVVEPRDAAGEPVRMPGEVSIVAYDTVLLRQHASRRHLAHVGTWLFNPADAATWFEEGQPRMRFELPWPPAGGPKNKDLQAVVRYKTADGRWLEATTRIAVQLTGRRAKLPVASTGGLPPVVPDGNGPRVAAQGAAGADEFSALRAPPPASAAPRVPATLPRREDVVRQPEVSDARPGTEVPSRQRPVWTPYR